MSVKKILFVDDEQFVLDGLNRLLREYRNRWELRPALNGKEALEIVENETIDMIISDVRMPEMNGLEMLAAIKADRDLQEIPVIIISTEGSDEKIKSVLEMGAKQFIKKPFSPEYVRKVLYEVIGMEDEETHERNERNNDGSDF